MYDNAAAFTGEIPRFYDSGMGPTLFEPYAEVLAGLVVALKPRSVLELAAGTGISSHAIATRLPDMRMTVTDLNIDMLAIAKEKVPSATFAVADAQKLDYDARAFDVVACQFGVMFLPDLARGFREARRVVTDNGAYCFSVWGSHADNPAAAIVDKLLAEQFPDDPPLFWRVPYSLSAIDPTVELLKSCGYARVDVSVVPIDAPVESWPRLAVGMLRGNPSGDQIQARGGSVEAVAAELASRLSRRFGEVPTTTPMQAIFYTAHAG